MLSARHFDVFPNYFDVFIYIFFSKSPASAQAAAAASNGETGEMQMHGRNVGPRKKSGATETDYFTLGLHHCWGENVRLGRATGRRTPYHPLPPEKPSL